MNFKSPFLSTKEGQREIKKNPINAHILIVSTIKPLTCAWSLISAIAPKLRFSVVKEPVSPQQTVDWRLIDDENLILNSQVTLLLLKLKMLKHGGGVGGVIAIYGINLR